MAYRQRTIEEKTLYGKQFSKKQRESYRAGKRYGFLIGVHTPKRKK